MIESSMLVNVQTILNVRRVQTMKKVKMYVLNESQYPTSDTNLSGRRADWKDYFSPM